MLEMLLDALTENIFNIVISILSIIVSYYIIPYIKNNLITWLKDKQLYNTVKMFVQAVEKLAESGIIEKCDKKQKVINLLKENGVEVTETVETFIESAVKELDLVASAAKDEILKN